MNKRYLRDILKLHMARKVIEVSPREFHVDFHGVDRYQSGTWVITLHIPKEYPFKSPSVGFKNRIFHPNIDFVSGSICLDVLNQKWSPLFDLNHIFDIFIPQLLIEPNPEDPLNVHAAKLYKEDQQAYNEKVLSTIQEFCPTLDNESDNEHELELEQELELSDLSDISDSGDIIDNEDGICPELSH